MARTPIYKSERQRLLFVLGFILFVLAAAIIINIVAVAFPRPFTTPAGERENKIQGINTAS